MQKLFAILFFSFTLTSKCFAGSEPPRMVKFDELEKLLASQNDTLYIINFWATWCMPCVKELPHFEEARQEYASKNVRILLVNLDFKMEYKSRVVPFVQKKQLQNEVWFLDEPDPNKWIDKVSPDWSGAIPFTIMYHGKSRKKNVYESSLTKQELTDKINLNLQ